MVNILSPVTPLTVQLPADLIGELQLLAREKQLSVDDLVREACLAFTEAYTWERCYKEWLRTHPDQPAAEFGKERGPLILPSSEAKPA